MSMNKTLCKLNNVPIQYIFSPGLMYTLGCNLLHAIKFKSQYITVMYVTTLYHWYMYESNVRILLYIFRESLALPDCKVKTKNVYWRNPPHPKNIPDPSVFY